MKEIIKVNEELIIFRSYVVHFFGLLFPFISAMYAGEKAISISLIISFTEAFFSVFILNVIILHGLYYVVSFVLEEETFYRKAFAMSLLYGLCFFLALKFLPGEHANTTTLIILTSLYLLFVEFPRILIISAYDHMDTNNFLLQFLKKNIIYLLYGFLIFSLLLGMMKLSSIQSLDILLITFNNLSLGLISIYILKKNGFQEKSKKVKSLLIVEGSFLFIIFGYVASFELL